MAKKTTPAPVEAPLAEALGLTPVAETPNTDAPVVAAEQPAAVLADDFRGDASDDDVATRIAASLAAERAAAKAVTVGEAREELGLEPAPSETAPTPVVALRDAEGETVAIDLSQPQEEIEVEWAQVDDVLSHVVLKAITQSVDDMFLQGQIDSRQAISLVAKAAQLAENLRLVEDEDFVVAKSLDYGCYTTDVAQLTQGGAGMAGGKPSKKPRKSKFQRAKAIRETEELIVSKAWTPIDPGMEINTDEDMLAVMAEHFEESYGYTDMDEAYEDAQILVKKLAKIARKK